jgi:lysophospholipid acyltransferase (LPLAT)-like uncharacterized protein
LLAWSIFQLIRVINLTLRWRLHDPHDVLGRTAGRPVIFCAWHNRLALALPAWRRYFLAQSPDRRIAAIASASRDGSLVAEILRLFGAQPVRGSSSRRGLHAMIELVEYAKNGFDLAITPDGPRGPLYSVQPGVVSLAQMTQMPIALLSYSLSRKISIKSWDRFQIPLPFTRCDLSLGELIHSATRSAPAATWERATNVPTRWIRPIPTKRCGKSASTCRRARIWSWSSPACPTSTLSAA